MLKHNPWLLPEGIEEILPTEAWRLERLRQRLLALFASWGYELVIPPVVDYLDSLLTGAGHDLALQTFTLTDQLSGELLGIRADMTPQVARIDAHHGQSDHPNRLCYVGTVLHARGDALEMTRSPMQIGAELYGHSGIASDLEIIELMLETLAQAGVTEVHLDVGHVAIYRALVRHAALDARQETEIFDVLQRKARADLHEIFEDCALARQDRQLFDALLDLHGDALVLATARQTLHAAGGDVAAALDELEALHRTLSANYPSLQLSFDLGELRGYHYHTGIVFAAFIPTLGREIARGGRYDSIGAVFGRARPATGFSSDLKLLCMHGYDSANQTPRCIILAPYDTDPALREIVNDLRAQGHIVIRRLPDEPISALPTHVSGSPVDYHFIVREGDHWSIRKTSP